MLTCIVPGRHAAVRSCTQTPRRTSKGKLYGHLPWLLRERDGQGELFFAGVRSAQAIYLDDLLPTVPDRDHVPRQGAHGPSRDG
ncbi:MAG: hypothetical protein IPK02_20230 [Candidatus Accumulibacter sp.]|uniref:Uncharacterized protein n=1 Tax=Candidatus Accumulibacter affinis TaxID=2954384 RepID=A0A935TAL2_9PROT|nr:hypothetical protein [Candidatus Accumulibacter affinis]